MVIATIGGIVGGVYVYNNISKFIYPAPSGEGEFEDVNFSDSTEMVFVEADTEKHGTS